MKIPTPPLPAVTTPLPPASLEPFARRTVEGAKRGNTLEGSQYVTFSCDPSMVPSKWEMGTSLGIGFNNCAVKAVISVFPDKPLNPSTFAMFSCQYVGIYKDKDGNYLRFPCTPIH